MKVGASVEPTVSRAHACAVLKIGQRRLRVLVQQGRLDVTGKGHGKRVTVSSLAELLIPRNSAQLVGKCGIPTVSVPNLSRRTVDAGPTSEHDETMSQVLIANNISDQIQPIGELITLASAAAATGLPDRVMKQLVETGRIPSVLIGTRRRVNREVLRAWARGELAR